MAGSDGPIGGGVDERKKWRKRESEGADSERKKRVKGVFSAL